MQWLRKASSLAWAAIAMISVAGALASCLPETRYRVASTLFDGVPPPTAQNAPEPPPPEPAAAEPVRTDSTAAPTSEPILPLPTPKRLRREPVEMIRARLPKDAAGNVEWVLAAQSGALQPLASTDGKIDPMPPLALDIHRTPGVPGFDVVFPHEPHTFWLRCDNCHPKIFTMKAGANPITMGAIFQGEYCGRCHGKVAFAPTANCGRCHVKLGGGG